MTALAFSGKTNILDLYRMIECGPNDLGLKAKVLSFRGLGLRFATSFETAEKNVLHNNCEIK